MAAHSSMKNQIWWTNLLGSMYQRGEHTDVNLVVEQKSIAVHRSVLAALSPLFHQLLENKMECQDTTIILDDFRYGFLNYLNFLNFKFYSCILI